MAKLNGRAIIGGGRSADCQAHTPFREITNISVTVQHDTQIIIDVTANAFLKHMIRNIVGSLLLIGQKNNLPSWLQSVLLNKDRTLAGPTAEAKGLHLVNVEYPEELEIKFVKTALSKLLS